MKYYIGNRFQVVKATSEEYKWSGVVLLFVAFLAQLLMSFYIKNVPILLGGEVLILLFFSLFFIRKIKKGIVDFLVLAIMILSLILIISDSIYLFSNICQ